MTASNRPPHPPPCPNVPRYKAAMNYTQPKKSIFSTQKLDQKHILHDQYCVILLYSTPVQMRKERSLTPYKTQGTKKIKTPGAKNMSVLASILCYLNLS